MNKNDMPLVPTPDELAGITSPESFGESDALVCDACGERMLPNVSTWDADGCAWICTNGDCSDFSGDELDMDDLLAVGVPAWVAVVIESLADYVRELR
jgi:hypothetical protein